MIFESHAHYDDENFDKDRDTLLASLEGHGIGTVINIGASLAGSEDTVKLAGQYPFIYGAVGVHPGEVEELTEEGIARLHSLCGHEKWWRLARSGWIITIPNRRYPCRRSGLKDSWSLPGR